MSTPISDGSALPPDSEAINVGRQTARGSGLMIIARLTTRLIDFLTMLTLTRMLLPADFGLVAIAMTLVSVAEAALDLPINQALLRLPRVTQSHYDTAFSLSLLRGVGLFAIFLVAAHSLAALYDDPRLVWLVIALGFAPVLRGLASPKLVEYQKKLSFWRDFVLEISGKLAAFVAGTGVALLTRSYWAIAVCTIFTPLAITVYSYYFAPYRPRWSLARLNVFYGFIGWASAASAVGSLTWQFDRLLLGRVSSLAHLGLFTTASDFSAIPSSALLTPIVRPLLAAFSRIQNDPARLADSYQRASSAVVSIGLPMLVGVSLTAEPLVFIVFGPRWMEAAHYVRWLSLTWIPALVAFPVVPLLMALGKMRLFLSRNVIEIIIKIPIAIVGVFAYGFIGIIIARFVSELLADILCLFIVRRLLGLSLAEQLNACWRAVLAIVTMVVAISLVLNILPAATTFANALLNLIVVASLGAIIYGSVLMTAWLAAGRPNSIESMIWTFVTRALANRRWFGAPPISND